ncbi:ATP-binding protein [Dactylosporangium aurantiacum]|uniref:ATP-binding protein n=1 Tax=Dactylosporangium aurantiacum TaxID=35754 RepID=A0A9Q9MIL3_9ACTN|nr:ATP-binding protein [Dactylosporangium aurantiacum]MDG6108227.1 ATP-binding protein [Dactylosporangium aurantiacum]UWZ53786.1 ATP-binding protein [Dactylosporangium aurantiacum]
MPRDRSTVPLTRRVLDAALGVFSVTRDCRDDIGLAVGEACANAVQHADLGADYQVTVTIHEDRCVIDVVDEGVGMEAVRAATEGDDAAADAESGRGLRIIHALADMVEFRRHQPHGVALRIVKMLTRVTPAPA